MNVFSRLFLAAFAVALPVIAVAASPALTIGPADGQTQALNYQFHGVFWNGQTSDFTGALVVKREGNDASVDARLSNLPKPETVAGKVGVTGGITANDPKSVLSEYNLIAALAQGAPAQLHTGDRWQAKADVSVSDHQNVTVTFDCSVQAQDAHQTVIAAVATRAFTLSYAGFSVPAKVSVRLASRFQGGNFVRADSQTDEAITAGPQSQTLHWNWSLTRKQ